MMFIEPYITKNYLKTFQFTSIQSCRQELIRQEALAVFDEEHNEFLGVLTPKDVLERPHILVADCLRHKTPVQPSWPVYRVLETMMQDQTNVLPVVTAGNRLEGLIYKSALLKAVWKKNEELTMLINEIRCDHPAGNDQAALATEGNSHELCLVISIDQSILLYNKPAGDFFYSRYHRPLTTGESVSCFFGPHFGLDAASFETIFDRTLSGLPALLETGSREEGNNTQRWYKTACQPVLENHRLTGVSITISNITRQKRKDLLLHEQKQMLKKIVYMQSHIIRHPLTNILGLMELLDTTELSPRNLELFDLLKTSAEQMDENIKDSVQMISTSMG
jgi:hypothetical protein